LWVALNTGPWLIRGRPQGLLAWLNFFRASLPLLVLALVLLRAPAALQRWGPRPVGLRLWLVYGVLGLLSGVIAGRGFGAAYWALAYIAAIGVALIAIRSRHPLRAARRLNALSWIVAAFFLVTMLVMVRGALFVETEYGITAYGIVNRAGTVAGGPVSRASGFARFAAVVGIVLFVGTWRSRGWRRFLLASGAAAAGALVYLMDSRGAILGAVAACGFTMMYAGRRARRVGIGLLVLAGLLLGGGLVAPHQVEKLENYLRRGQSSTEMATLTGRTRTWSRAVAVAAESPLLGFGFQADRALIQEHVHNSYLYALLTAGYPGLLLFVLGLAWFWVTFFRILKRVPDDERTRAGLVTAASLMMFFTVRGIPEVSGAMFGVDLLVMVPAMAYVEVLGAALRCRVGQRAGTGGAWPGRPMLAAYGLHRSHASFSTVGRSPAGGMR